jgi:Flp pilus assembly protein TadD
LEDLALVLRDQGKTQEAVTAARECLALRKNRPEEWLTFDARSLLGGLLLMQKEYADAEPLLLSGYEGMKQREERIPVPDRTRLKAAGQSLVQLYEATGQADRVLLWKKALAEFDHGGTEKTVSAVKTAPPP